MSKQKLKEFKDLKFHKHKSLSFKSQARMNFPNRYGVSVITGEGAYSSEESPYELAVFYRGKLCYTSGITNDVLGYLTEKDVTFYMERVQKKRTPPRKLNR